MKEAQKHFRDLPPGTRWVKQGDNPPFWLPESYDRTGPCPMIFEVELKV
jgi:hypothetical protein